jgi:hypothetical protein
VAAEEAATATDVVTGTEAAMEAATGVVVDSSCSILIWL